MFAFAVGFAVGFFVALVIAAWLMERNGAID